jgi:hypothetical protein
MPTNCFVTKYYLNILEVAITWNYCHQTFLAGPPCSPKHSLGNTDITVQWQYTKPVHYIYKIKNCVAAVLATCLYGIKKEEGSYCQHTSQWGCTSQGMRDIKCTTTKMPTAWEKWSHSSLNVFGDGIILLLSLFWALSIICFCLKKSCNQPVLKNLTTFNNHYESSFVFR